MKRDSETTPCPPAKKRRGAGPEPAPQAPAEPKPFFTFVPHAPQGPAAWAPEDALRLLASHWPLPFIYRGPRCVSRRWKAAFEKPGSGGRMASRKCGEISEAVAGAIFCKNTKFLRWLLTCAMGAVGRAWLYERDMGALGRAGALRERLEKAHQRADLPPVLTSFCWASALSSASFRLLLELRRRDATRAAEKRSPRDRTAQDQEKWAIFVQKMALSACANGNAGSLEVLAEFAGSSVCESARLAPAIQPKLVEIATTAIRGDWLDLLTEETRGAWLKLIFFVLGLGSPTSFPAPGSPLWRAVGVMFGEGGRPVRQVLPALEKWGSLTEVHIQAILIASAASGGEIHDAELLEDIAADRRWFLKAYSGRA